MGLDGPILGAKNPIFSYIGRVSRIDKHLLVDSMCSNKYYYPSQTIPQLALTSSSWLVDTS